MCGFIIQVMWPFDVWICPVTNASEGSMQEQDWARMLSFSRNSGVEFQHTVYSMFSLFAFQYIVPIEGGGGGWNVFFGRLREGGGFFLHASSEGYNMFWITY